MFVMTRKLKALKIHLQEWNEEFSGNVNDKVDQAQNSLEAVQVDISVNGMTMDSFQAEIDAQANLQNTIEMQYKFVKSKANLRWLADMDRNSKFFYR